MLIAVVVIAIILAAAAAFLLLPFRYRVMVHCDVLHNHTLFSFRAANVPVLYGSIRFSGNDLYIKTKRREAALKVIAPASDERSLLSYLSPTLPRLKVKKINLYTQTGKSDDAFFTAMATGLTKMTLLTLIAVIKTYHKDMVYDAAFESVYNVDHLQATANCIVSISVANIIKAVAEIMSYHKKKTKGAANERRKQQN